MKVSQLNETEYHFYYAPYLEALGDVSLMEEMKKGKADFEKMVNKIPSDKLKYAYAGGKWTIAELLLHIIDAERVFQYRALRFARKDETSLPGFDQDDYVPASKANNRSKESLLKEFLAVRESSLALFNTFDDDVLMFKGTANGNIMSVRALGFIISGHLKHHLKILEERYL